MSKFFSSRHNELKAYTPGEQLNSDKLIKLNTNESPYSPTERTAQYVSDASKKLNLYPELDSKRLRELISQLCDVDEDCIFISNSSDEALNFSFLAFFDKEHPAFFPDITYGFYPVFAKLYDIPYIEIPLKSDFSFDYRDYLDVRGGIVIANPNAPTGLSIPVWQVEELVRKDSGRLVIVDEAYVDFGGESCVGLTKKYPNIIVIQTFSKSRSLAGGRLGFAIGAPELIRDLETIRYSTNPYNVNRLSVAAGIAALEDNDICLQRCREIIKTREYTAQKLSDMGFECLASRCNFIFARHSVLSGIELYQKLRERNILIRHFDIERISDYNRITIGTREQMDKLLSETAAILNEVNKK